MCIKLEGQRWFSFNADSGNGKWVWCILGFCWSNEKQEVDEEGGVEENVRVLSSSGLACLCAE